jgi:hypothetical protein
MKMMKWAVTMLVLATGILISPGCKKQEASVPVDPNRPDVVKLQQAFANNTEPEVQQELTGVAFGLRYGDPVKALMSLEKLAALPNITEDQKKVVNATSEAFKKMAAQQPAPANQ